MSLLTRFFNSLLLCIFIIYTQNYNFFYEIILCSKNPVSLLSKGYLNNKLFYYYGDIKIQELSHRIQFLLNNFDKIDFKTVKYLQNDLIIINNNPYNSFYHPHFLVELKNNIDNFNNFYINFQMSTKSKLGFEKLANTNLNMRNKIQYISPYIRVYVNDTVKILENEYIHSDQFIDTNKININNYVFKSLKEYTYNLKISKK